MDTSAWVEFDRATGSEIDRRVVGAVGDGSAASTEPVLMEVLAGARDEHAAESLRGMLTSLHWIPFDAVADFEGAAKVYRTCRAKGVTPAGLVDCLIGSVALRAGVPLLTADSGFARMAQVLPLRLA